MIGGLLMVGVVGLCHAERTKWSRMAAVIVVAALVVVFGLASGDA